jgi:hypothetical protein
VPTAKVPPLHLAMGNYFSLSVRSPFSRLDYRRSWGASHARSRRTGQVWPGRRMGRRDRLRRRSRRATSFYAAIRTYWSDLPEGALQPGYADIRPKIARPGGSTTDFLLQTEKDHGVPGLINLFGIESPRLTASVAIGWSAESEYAGQWAAPVVQSRACMTSQPSLSASL